MANLSLSNVSKRYGDHAVVDEVSLDVAEGEFLALLGPSGCGKTTLLRLIAGFERTNGGCIRFDQRTMSNGALHVPPEERHVGIVFQSYALWPHMSVAANIGYPLKVARINGEVYRRRVDEAMATVGLSGLGDRRPAALSGGQRQRVALARCLVMEPSVVLLDEPLANLDVHLRAAMEEEFTDFHRKTGATMVYVTHDQAEAMALADRIAVMEHGRVVQVAAPRTLYREPATGMVAGFIGRGCVLDGEVRSVADDGHAEVDVLGARLTLRCGADSSAGPAKVCLRPEDLSIADTGIAGRVHRVVYRGATSSVEVQTETGDRATLILNVAEAPAEGTPVCVQVADGWVIPGR